MRTTIDESGTPPASVGRSEDLPPGFESRTAEVNGVTIHYVSGGRGEVVVLLHGWPQSWREWKPILPTLAEKYTVIAPDLRGMGDSSMPAGGYDAKSVADDVRALCRELGHPRVAVVGHDIGFWPAYAWAAGHPDEVSKLVAVEGMAAGVGEVPQAMPGGKPVWHMAFHMVPGLAEALIAGREREYLSWFFGEFDGGAGAVPGGEIDDAVAALSRPGRLAAGFAHYRAMFTSATQNAGLATTKLKMPVLAVGGDKCMGDLPGRQLGQIADDATTAVVKGCGHWVAAERPKEFAKLLTDFLAKGSGAK